MRKQGAFCYHILLIFSFLGVLFIPFSFKFLPFQTKITRFLFEDLILGIASLSRSIDIANPEISSDSTTFYLLFLVLFLIATLLVTSFSFFDFWQKHKSIIIQFIQMMLVFYVSLVMLKYGFDKIFKSQFYLPEPNTLYTPLGRLDKDILYWSTIGTSRIYNLFLGSMEIIPAILILFNRTRILGLVILSGVLFNVVFVNFGFDISVKLYSSFLLFISLLLLAPSIQSLWQFFILNKSAVLTNISGKQLVPSKVYKQLLKSLVIVFIFTESLFPYLKNGRYNDDETPRNYLHGAYEVIEIEKKNNLADIQDIKRIFIHRKNYFIFQYKDDSMEDFSLKIDSVQGKFILTNYENQVIIANYNYSEKSKILALNFDELGLTIHSKSLPWKALPLLQPLFHWTVDEVE